ncbi:hypothetical protein [uncultured Tateyamaria sp.]|uniref:hypothetical protein n=1 Tax=uncultured Tateyamaria sp. TaxID=455651 RepID=UPI002628D983|nr:hypothetical protein [uncultured Tateyamaria sp.]
MGDWEYRTPTEIQAASDLIVTGVLTGRTTHEIAGSDNLETIGTVDIGEVLKGSTQGQSVRVLLAPTRPGGLISSADVQIADGQSGLWYLQKTQRDGLYSVQRPDQFVPTDKAAEQIDALKSQ